MKFIVSTLLVAVAGVIIGLLAGIPWYGFVFTSFLIGLGVHQKGGWAFLSGFLGLFLFWGGLAAWIDFNNQHLLAQKVALIFPLGGSYILLIIVTGTLGGLLSGFATMTGSFLRTAINSK